MSREKKKKRNGQVRWPVIPSDYDQRYGLIMAGEEDEEYLENFAYECIACRQETIFNPCHHCGTENPEE